MPKVIEDQQLFHAAIQTVIEHGYAGATTKQMAIAADVSEATLFRRYGSKMQLVTQAIASIIEQTGFDGAAHYTGDVSADLLRVVQAYQDAVVTHGQFMAILLTEIPRHPEMENMIDTPFQLFQRIGDLLARYQSEGVLRQEDPLHALAGLLGPVVFGSMMRMTKQRDRIPPVDLSQHVDTFIHGRGGEG